MACIWWAIFEHNARLKSDPRRRKKVTRRIEIFATSEKEALGEWEKFLASCFDREHRRLLRIV